MNMQFVKLAEQVAQDGKVDGAELMFRLKDGTLGNDNEQEWLDAMIEADGEVDALERALLDRIAEEG